jgi:hypothetical protein
MNKSQAIDLIKEKRPSLLVMAGAGDIDAMLLPIKEILISN